MTSKETWRYYLEYRREAIAAEGKTIKEWRESHPGDRKEYEHIYRLTHPGVQEKKEWNRRQRDSSKSYRTTLFYVINLGLNRKMVPDDLFDSMVVLATLKRRIRVLSKE